MKPKSVLDQLISQALEKNNIEANRALRLSSRKTIVLKKMEEAKLECLVVSHPTWGIYTILRYSNYLRVHYGDNPDIRPSIIQEEALFSYLVNETN